MSGPALAGVLVFLLLAPAGVRVIGWLDSMGIRKRIRTDGPASHHAKAGTPTMGGLIFVAAGVLGGALMLALGHTEVLWPMIATVTFAILGTFDDLKGIKDIEGVGWLARIKFPWQWILGLLLAGGMYLSGASRPFWLPFAGQALDLGPWFIPVGAFLIVGWVNAANLTDGLDGLAAGTAAIVAACLAALLAGSGQGALSYWSMILAGGLLAFLWHNAHPAQVFMGDVGAEALGAALAMVALASGQMILLLLAGVPLLSEAVSVMLQVAYFKYTRKKYGEGRRIFRMAPLHHHFEQLGHDEVQITLRFWIATAITSLLALALGGAI